MTRASKLKHDGEQTTVEYMAERVYEVFESGTHWIIMVAPGQRHLARAIQALYPEPRPTCVYEVFELGGGWFLVLASKAVADDAAVVGALRSVGDDLVSNVELTEETLAKRDVLFLCLPERYAHVYAAINSYVEFGRATMIRRTAPWN